jgi:protein required for attachment to host cells
MKKLWVLVSNASRAQVYECGSPVGSLTPVAAFSHDASRQHPRDLVADKPGRVHDRRGAARHGMEPVHTTRENEAEEFAHQLDDFLSAARLQGRYADLAVLAAPRFLGRLREAYRRWLPESALMTEIAKDLTAMDPEQIRAELEPLLRPVRH